MLKNKKNEHEKREYSRPSRAFSSRIKLLFVVIFVLFLVLIGRLYNMQIVNKDFYLSKLKQGGSISKVSEATPRGQIYDSKGTLLVTNKAEMAVRFTRSNKLDSEDMRNIALKLVEIVPDELENDKLTERDKKDFFLADPKNLERVQDSLTEKEKTDKSGDPLPESELYPVYVSKVTDADVDFSPSEDEAAKIYKKMNGAANFNTVTLISGNITDEQVARIAEKEKELVGVSVGTDWEREYSDTALESILGTVSSEKAGIPAEELDDYLAKGYSRNDRVGTSYIEKSYESELQGKKQTREIVLDANGNIKNNNVLEKGKSGNNLKLTVDLKFQEGVDSIVQDYFNQVKAQGFAAPSEGAYAVVLNPNTGAILAMSGVSQDIKTGVVTKNSLGTIQNVFVPGSVVKGATIASGWENGVISGNQTLVDQPIQLGSDSNTKQSWFTNGGTLPITAVQALEYSSNTYMIQIALKMMNQPYFPNMTLTDKGMKDTLTKLRKTYGEFGMGVSTGVDIAGESTGYIPDVDSKAVTIGGVMDESFGQFDTYTTMQLAQYAATVANGGTRYAPHIVEGIYDSNDDSKIGKEVEKIEPKKLNSVDISADDMDIIQQGFYQVVNSGSSLATGKDIADGASVSISAKTGTAETYGQLPSGETVATTANNVVAYAPSNDPQIAIGVMLPNLTDDATHANQYITRDIVNLYNSMYGFK